MSRRAPSEKAYHYTFSLGQLGSPSGLRAFTVANAAGLFYPLTGLRDGFKVGDQFILSLQGAPLLLIKVIGMTATSFTFEATKWNVEGAGRQITFAFQSTSHGPQLSVSTSANGFWLTTGAPGLSSLDFDAAHNTWSQVAGNIRASYDRTVTDGLPPPIRA